MRRKINRMLSFGLALIMMFSIAGCGSLSAGSGNAVGCVDPFSGRFLWGSSVTGPGGHVLASVFCFKVFQGAASQLFAFPDHRAQRHRRLLSELEGVFIYLSQGSAEDGRGKDQALVGIDPGICKFLKLFRMKIQQFQLC